jgi:co-chaperonin GroES (HSP10)
MSNSTPKISSLGKIGEARLDLVPQLDECRPGIQPVEYNVVVAPAKMPDKIGSLHIPDEFKDNQALAMQVGRIVSMSPLAFDYAKWPDDASKPSVGQIAWFARYAGKEFEGIDGKTYRILKDKDIGAVIEEAPRLAVSDRDAPKVFEFDSLPTLKTGTDNG